MDVELSDSRLVEGSVVLAHNVGGKLMSVGVLTRAALGNGLIEATLLRRMEVVRDPSERSSGFIGKMEARIERALAALDAQASSFAVAGALRADQISAACALGREACLLVLEVLDDERLDDLVSRHRLRRDVEMRVHL